jgi:tight adherence protein B
MARGFLAAFVGLLVVLVAGMPAAAEEAVRLEVTGVQATPGKVAFFLAAGGVPAHELTAQSVSVRAGGEQLPVQVEQFAGTRPDAEPLPRGVVLALDASGSMNEGGLLDTARTAAAAYANGLPPDVELGLVTFADRAATALAPTTDRGAFAAALDRVTAAGATALYDGVAHAAGLLAPAGRYADRRIVVLSDGADTASTTDPAGLAARLATAGATLDVVAVTRSAESATVSQLAAGTGGQLIAATDPTAARRAFRALASVLSAPVLVTAEVPPARSGSDGTLAVALHTADGDAAAEVPVRFAVDPRAAVTQRAVAASAGSRVLLLAGVGSVAAALLLAALVALQLLFGRSALRARLRQIDAYTGGARTSVPDDAPQGSALMRKALELSDRAVERNNQRGRIAASLERAGMDLRPQEWYLMRAAAAAAAALLFALLLPWWFGLPAGLVAGWFGTATYRGVREGRRSRRFADLLPDALQLVVSALRSGFSLAQAIDAVVREGPEPINTEFGRAIAETRLGGELEDALERAAARNGSRDLAWLVMAIRIQREVGGNLSEVLETANETMRERARLNRHVRALSAEGRLSAYILTGMPVLVSAWMFISNGEYLRPLYTELFGLMMLGAGVCALAVGVFWMSRIVKVEV